MKTATIKVKGRDWTIKPISLATWGELQSWIRSRPKTHDPLAQLARLPLDRMPAELVEKLTSQAMAEDRKLNDLNPGGDAARDALLTPEGIIKAMSLLSDEPEDVVRDLVFTLVSEGRQDELTEALASTVGTKNG